MRTGIHILILVLFFITAACGKKVMSSTDFLKWLEEPDNGLVKTKEVNGLQIKIKVLPPIYSAYKEMESMKQKEKKQLDSLSTYYGKSLSFLFSIGPVENGEASNDIMFQSVQSYREYTQRVLAMNFEMEEYVRIKINGREYKPVLSSMENIYGLQNKRSILFVFAPSEKNDTDFNTAEKIDFIYSGELFDTGINHFVFNRSAIQSAPEILL